MAALFPQLEILELLGQGGMGAVYKARQPALDRLIALKILPPQISSGPGFADRFTGEARALARLNHPNVVAVHEFGQAGDFHYHGRIELESEEGRGSCFRVLLPSGGDAADADPTRTPTYEACHD